MKKAKTNGRILIAEADRRYAAELKSGIEANSDFTCRLCHSGDQVNEKIEKHECDILLINLMLPVFDGIAVLDRLDRTSSGIKLIVVLSSVTRDVFVREALAHGADYCIITPIEPQDLANRLTFLYETALSGKGNAEEYTDNTFYPSAYTSSVRETLKKNALLIPEYRKKIRRLLSQIGIPAKVKGFSFLEEAVVMTLEDRCAVNNVTKIIYPIIAKRLNSTHATVERGIRTAIDIAWGKPGGPELMKKSFKFAPGEFQKKPTNAELIAILADKITVDDV